MRKAASELTRQLAKAVLAAVWLQQTGRRSSFWTSIVRERVKGGSHRGLKLTDQVTKLLEWVLDFYIHEMVNIYEMQFGFLPGRGTDAIFIVHQQQEKYIANNKLPYFAFVDLEKAFHHVPRKVPWWALRKLGVKDWAVHIIRSISELRAWKAGMESKGLHFNMKKTKFLVSGDDHDVLKKSDKHPFAVSCSGVGSNSILCS